MQTALQPIDVEKTISVITGASKPLIEEALAAKVDDQNALTFAVDMLTEIKNRVKQIEGERTALVKPLNDTVKNLNAKFKNLTQPLEEAESALRSKVLVYQRQVEAEARKAAEEERARIQEALRLEAEKAAEQGQQEEAQQLIHAAQVVQVKPEEQGRGGFLGGKSSIQKRWTYEVTDIAALAASNPHLVEPNSAAIGGLIRGGVRELPGVRIFQTESLSVRG